METVEAVRRLSVANAASLALSLHCDALDEAGSQLSRTWWRGIPRAFAIEASLLMEGLHRMLAAQTAD